MNTDSTNPFGDNLAAMAWADMSPPGHGKSHNLVTTWGSRVVYVVKSLSGVRMAKKLGIDIDTRDVRKGGQVLIPRSPKDIVGLVRWYKKQNRKVPFAERRFIGFAIDEFSALFQRREAELREEYGNNKMANMLIYGNLNREGKELIGSITDLGAHVHGTFEFAPLKVREDKGIGNVRVKAQTNLPGRQLATHLAYAFDTIAVIRKDPGRWPYPVCYTRDVGDDDTLDKDRLNTLGAITPLQTREILLHNGFWLPPLRNEGEERYIEKLAAKMADVDPDDDEEMQALYRTEHGRRVKGKRTVPIFYTTFYRAACRAELRRNPGFYASLLDLDNADEAETEDDTTPDEE